jgi:hypothetical protein
MKKIVTGGELLKAKISKHNMHNAQPYANWPVEGNNSRCIEKVPQKQNH